MFPGDDFTWKQLAEDRRFPGIGSGEDIGFFDDPFNPGESCMVTVNAPNVTDVDTDDPPDAMLANHVLNFTVSPDVVCGAMATPISAVQGSGTTSPMTNTIVEIEGVVVGAYPGTTGFQGFHVQEEDADRDGNPATSEGIFIFEPNGGATYAVGDTVRVKGQVAEFPASGLTLTELSNLHNVDVCSSGDSVTPTPIEMPFESLSFAERYEGMLVEFPSVHDMVVTETFNFGRFGELMLTTDERQWTPTHLVEPGAAATAMQAANNLDRIVLDDGRNDQNIDPTVFPEGGLSASNTIRAGDTVVGGSFVLEQRFGAYRLQPTADRPNFVATNPRPATARSRLGLEARLGEVVRRDLEVLEAGDRVPMPGVRERRYDVQARLLLAGASLAPVLAFASSRSLTISRSSSQRRARRSRSTTMRAVSGRPRS